MYKGYTYVGHECDSGPVDLWAMIEGKGFRVKKSKKPCRETHSDPHMFGEESRLAQGRVEHDAKVISLTTYEKSRFSESRRNFVRKQLAKRWPDYKVIEFR
jgi:hypothetical protein